MKRAVILLSAAMMLAQAGATATERSISDVQNPSLEKYREHVKILLDMTIPDLANHVRHQSRAEFAVATNNLFSLFLGRLEESLHDDPTGSNFYDPGLRRKIAENFWRLEFLVRTFYPEMMSFGVKDQFLWDGLALLKKRFTDLGIVLRDPFNERFTDVPEGHWADEAIHNLRRNGIVYGYPDGRFRA